MTVESVVLNKKNNRLAAERKKGFTLTEIAIVLGIIGLILGAIWTAASSVYANQRAAHADTAILQIAQSVRTLYATSNTDAGLTTANLITAGAVPSDLVNAAGTGLIAPYAGGTTTVIPTTDGQGFVISMSNLPRAACINMLMALGGANHDPSLFLATGSAAAAAAPASAVPAVTTQMTPAIAGAAAVTAAGDGQGIGGCTLPTAVNFINFGFGLK